MKTFDWFKKVMILVVIIITIGFSYSYSHEGHGWFHMKDSTGPCIGTEKCGYNMIWMIDYNDDGIIDRCIANRLIYGKWHIKDYKIDKKNNKCTCAELTWSTTAPGALDGTYRCFAETHPNEAKTLDARKLGGIKIGQMGLKYRVMAECRQDKPDYILWVQFIDSAKADEQFDNTANFSVYIMVKNGKVTSAKRSIMIAINDIVDHCVRNKLKIKDFMHTAPKLPIKPKLGIDTWDVKKGVKNKRHVKLISEQLAPEQNTEDKTILNIIKEVNKQIPKDTIVTDTTIKKIGDRIEKIIIKAGYVKEFYMRTVFCPVGHIHYIAIINAKTRNDQYELEARYYYKKQAIKPKIDLKNTT